jgi:mannose-6-phosphate isomerase-like protein (cupin superfamily)
VWPRDRDWFINDPLGHAAHLHPGASEIYFVASGQLEVVVGSARLELATGDLCLIPADTYHDPVGTMGTDLGLFCVVAPNWRGRRWQTDPIPPAALANEPVVARGPVMAGALPSDKLLCCSCLELPAGATEEFPVAPGAERVLYVLDGELELHVGGLAGRFTAHQFAHIPSNLSHRIRAGGDQPLRLLSVHSTPQMSDDGSSGTGQ